MGGRVHPSIASHIELIAYRQEEKSKAAKKLDDYTRQCAKAKVGNHFVLVSFVFLIFLKFLMVIVVLPNDPNVITKNFHCSRVVS